MNYSDPTLRQILAGEYVLGALHGAARARFEQLLKRDPALRRIVHEWQDDLVALSEQTRPVKPPGHVLDEIKHRIDAGDRATLTSRLWQRLGFWRAFSLVGATAAIVLAVITTLLFTRPPTAVAPSYVAVLHDQAATPALVVTAYKNPFRMKTEPLALPKVTANQVLQIWAIEKETGKVAPLTTVAADAPHQIALSDAEWKLVKNSHSLAVSIEPAGVTATAPTTPLLFTGLCINLKGG